VSSSSNATAQQAATQLASDASAEGEDVAAAVTEQIVTPGSGLSVQAAAEGEDAQPLSPRSLDNLFRHWF
jgi:hypothetical protein